MNVRGDLRVPLDPTAMEYVLLHDAPADNRRLDEWVTADRVKDLHDEDESLAEVRRTAQAHPDGISTSRPLAGRPQARSQAAL